jgi:putative ABC transport system permease protein
MQKLTEWFRRVRYWINRDAYARELEEEMRIHLAMRSERLSSMMDEPGVVEPHALAQRRFGNTTTMLQRSRDMWGFGLLEDLRGDLRFAMRRLVQRPAFTCAVVGVMAIGIGATTAMFSAVDATMLRGLPFTAPHQLVRLPGIGMPIPGADDPGLTVLDVRRFTDLFSDVAMYGRGAVNLSDETRPQRLNAAIVTPDFFPLLDVKPIRGRLFAESELKASANVVLISYALWQRQYGGRDITSLTIRLNNIPHQVVGVLPDNFTFPSLSEVWVPLSVPPKRESLWIFRESAQYRTIARLQEGISPAAATAQLRLRWKQHANSVSTGSPVSDEQLLERTENIPLRESLSGTSSQTLFALLCATGLLLLVACANVSNLLFAHAAVRQREMVLRRVMGASRARIVRQLLIESGTLSLVGATLGIGFAAGALQIVRAIMPPALAGIASASIDWRVLTFAVALSAVAGVISGLLPALSATRADADKAIKAHEARTTTGRASGGLRRALIGVELALTTSLLVGATLMIRSFDQLMNVDTGVRADQVGTLELAMPTVNMTAADRLHRVEEMVRRLQETPGIQSAGVVNNLPLNGVNGLGVNIRVAGVEPNAQREPAHFLQASDGYFASMRIRLLEGRLFNASADSLSPKVAIVSETVARSFWPDRSAVGRTFAGPGESGEFTVIGVVSDLRVERVEDAPSPQLYLPIYSRLPNTVALVARSNLEPAELLRRMNDAVRAVDPSQAVFNLRMMDEVIGTSVAPRRTSTLLISGFALLALLIASVGVYASVSFNVSNRARELGIRAALGATGSRLLTLVSTEIAIVSAAGIAVGLLIAWMGARVLEGMIYGVGVRDPLSFAVVPLVLLVPTIAAAALPAVRAFRMDPATVMRAD